MVARDGGFAAHNVGSDVSNCICHPEASELPAVIAADLDTGVR